MKKIIALLLLCSVCYDFVAAQSPLSLSALKDSALHNNRTLRKGRLDIEAAKEQRKEAFTHYFPSISGNALAFRANSPMVQMDVDVSPYITPELGAILAQMLPAEAVMALSSPITIEMMKKGKLANVMALQPVFAGRRIVLGNKLALLGEEASQLQLQLSEKDVEAQVEQYYWQLVSMHEKSRTLDAVDSLLGTIRHDVETAVKAGVALNNDLLQVQLRQNEIQSQRLKLNNGQTLVKMLVGQICGLSLTPNPSPVGEGSDSLFEVEMPDMKQDNTAPIMLPSPAGEGFGLRVLPEYQLLEMNVEAAQLQRKMEVGKYLPSVAVGAGYTYHNLLGNKQHFGMIFATVNVPITDWWGGSYAIRRKKIAEQQAREQLIDKTQLLEIRAQKAANDVIEAQSQLALATQSMQQADENLRIHRNTYRAGTATMRDLLQAQLLQQQACDQRIDAFIALQNARLAYRQATGLNP